MKVHATPSLIKRWTRAIQVAFLSSMAESFPQIADVTIVHGGTALSLAWQGPRHSEDVDMLFDANCIEALHAIMGEISPRLNKFLAKEIPGLKLDVRIKRSERKLQCFHLAGSMPDVLGSAKVKLEFWPVSLEYLQAYSCDSTCFCARLKRPMKVATLESIYYDKLIALCLREFVKFRDIFDAWWVAQACDHKAGREPEIGQFMCQATAYGLSSLSSEKGGRIFIDPGLDIDEMARRLRDDLQKWLHEDAFLQYDENDFKNMVLHAQAACKSIYQKNSVKPRPIRPVA